MTRKKKLSRVSELSDAQFTSYLQSAMDILTCPLVGAVQRICLSARLEREGSQKRKSNGMPHGPATQQ